MRSALFAFVLVACAPADGMDFDSDPASAEQGITAADGFRAIAPSRGLYQSLAIVGDRAFLGTNERAVDLVDTNTMRKTGSVPGRIVADTLTASDDKVFACGLRDDSPADPFGGTPADRNYVITIIDAVAARVDGEIRIGMERFLKTNPSAGFVNLPDMACRFEPRTRTMTVSFAQDELGRELVTFALPAPGATVDWSAIPGAQRTAIDTDGSDTVKAVVVDDTGLTYAAGGAGLRRQPPGATRAATLRQEPREHLVDLAIEDGLVYAVDHSRALVVAQADTGATVERVAIPDFLHAVALAPEHVLVLGRGGLFVAKRRWSR